MRSHRRPLTSCSVVVTSLGLSVNWGINDRACPCCDGYCFVDHHRRICVRDSAHDESVTNAAARRRAADAWRSSRRTRRSAGAAHRFRAPGARQCQRGATRQRGGVGYALDRRRENQPAESVFKNIKILKGIPAGRLVNIMNMGFGRSLGVSCGFCHVPGKWDLDDKEQKNTARLMFAMVQTINRDYIAKVPVDSGTPRPAVNCFTCHRGNQRPMGPEGGPPPGNRTPSSGE